MQHITVQGHVVRVAPHNATADEAETTRYAVQAYGFLLKPSDLGVHHFSFADLATKIGQHYDLKDPRHAEVCRILRAVHARNI